MGTIRAWLVCSLTLTVTACGDDGAPPPDGGRGDAAATDAAPDDGRVPTDGFIPPGALVTTELGPVMGTEDEDLLVFRGIPYAAPPVGALRFRRPEPHPPWTDARDATRFGPICPQREGTGTGPVIGDEDCLSLNVWTHAAGTTPRPVMVFIHGGGFVQGAGSLDTYEGSALARAGDVVVVTLNYRLGALGFLATDELSAEVSDGSAGNYGLFDQIAALEWLQRNLAAFGGDPTNVTIFGESAGAVSTCVLLGSPLTAGLFHRAVIESGGSCTNFPTLRTGTPGRAATIDRGVEIVTAAGCGGVSDELACMRALTAEAVVDATWAGDATALGLPDTGVAIDEVLLTEQPRDALEAGRGQEVPVVVGSNADEASLFTLTTPVRTEAAFTLLVRTVYPSVADDVLALYPVASFATPKAAYNALFSDVAFICPALAFAEATSGSTAPAFAYHFTHTGTGAAAALGSFHGLELAYVFDNYDPRYAPTDGDLRVRDAMQGAWASFARDGAPATTPPWNAFDPSSPEILLFEDPPAVATAIRDGRCAQLERLGIVP